MKQIVLALVFFVAGAWLSHWYFVVHESAALPNQVALAASGTSAAPQTQAINVTEVVAKDLRREARLPGELQAYQDVALYPKVQGFVSEIPVDRGSVITQGQVLAILTAPELNAQRSEAEAKVQAAEARRLEVESKVPGIRAQQQEVAAKLATDEATYTRLKKAASTPGVVAENEVEAAMRIVEADQARIRAFEENIKAAEAEAVTLLRNVEAARDAAKSIEEMVSYLQITAPFEGVITERNSHPGSLVGPSAGVSAGPMLRLRQVSKLRLVVAVPETLAGGIPEGETRTFTVLASPGEEFQGVVRRISRSLDMKTRTMPVELDVDNSEGRLAPGMYVEVVWPVRRAKPSLFIPPTAVATTTEKTFVVRVKDGNIEWVDVRKGMAMGDLIEVFGGLEVGDEVAIRGTDELRPGTTVVAKQVTKGP